MANERKLIYADSGEIAAEYMKKHIVPSDSDFLRGYLAGVDAVAKGLAELPPVDAMEVVHGRWVVEDADSGEHGCYEAYMIVECSHCGQSHEVETGQFGWVYDDPFPFNYCPNCGAKMDGGV